ncbi:DNA ligase 4-like isoform X2 [Zophobas morio]|uniref:DNA ligase 4-like isoform X2 n=1 Tax=Zophobas morio TaxID=2755281 RepID=UPI0030833495
MLRECSFLRRAVRVLLQVAKFIESLGEVFVETKFDGDRVIIHFHKGQLQYWTRSGNNLTDLYSKLLPSKITGCFAETVENCIIDGEMMGYDTELDVYIPKNSVDVTSFGAPSARRASFVAFDIVLLNNNNIASRPFKVRKEILRGVLKEQKGILLVAETRIASSKNDISELLNEAIENREEGVMVKDPNSEYVPNRRRNSGWIKVKPEFVSELSDLLDLLIIGGYYGSGKRKNIISHFLLGVLLQTDDPGPQANAPVFLSFCKVGSGYTLEDLESMSQKLDRHWIKFSIVRPPHFLELTEGFKEKPDVVIHPSRSMVVSVKAAEIVPSTKFKTGCTLRFPRLEYFRDDKEWRECLNSQMLYELWGNAGGRLLSKRVEQEHFELATKRSRRPVAGLALMDKYKGPDLSAIEEDADIFKGKEFLVACEGKKEIEILITKLGGLCVQNFRVGKTTCVIANKENLRVRSIVKSKAADVVSPQWIQECSAAEKLLPFNPKHLLFATEATEKDVYSYFDRHGDSYTEPIKDQDELKGLFDKMPCALTNQSLDIADLEHKYMDKDGGECVMSVFRICVCYVDFYKEVGNPQQRLCKSYLEISAAQIEMFGGKVVKSINGEIITHVVCDRDDYSRLEAINRINRGRVKKYHVVEKCWVSESIKYRRKVKETLFPCRL